ncbi:DUF4332 domain-containing protein [Haloferula sp.]|uniref:DUF4332 domain-containing protein n=1 Tax=Haloferula sp. TaxID=2497595 RepID=UPI003C7556BF
MGVQNLKSIKGIRDGDFELLEAAGWVDTRRLAMAQPGEVLTEIEKANEVLRLVKSVPELDVVAGWISEAQEMTGELPAEPEVAEVEEDAFKEAIDFEVEPEAVVTGPVNFEEDPDVREMLDQAPLAIPLPNRMLAAQGIAPSEITIAPVLNRAESDLDVRVTAKQRTIGAAVSKNSPKGRHAGVVKIADSGRSSNKGSRRTLDTARVRTMDLPDEPEEEEGHPHLQKRRQTRDERLTLLRTTRESTNRGKKPGTRRYIRGVLHDRPYKVWFGCLVVALFQITVPLAIIAAALLIITEHSPTKLEWVPSWIIAFPLALPILGIMYFTISFGVKCRVCGQQVLVHRQCRKNKKAHHVYGLGYIFPLAVQTLLFRWFNCTFCGTSIRIKE